MIWWKSSSEGLVGWRDSRVLRRRCCRCGAFVGESGGLVAEPCLRSFGGVCLPRGVFGRWIFWSWRGWRIVCGGRFVVGFDGAEWAFNSFGFRDGGLRFLDQCDAHETPLFACNGLLVPGLVVGGGKCSQENLKYLGLVQERVEVFGRSWKHACAGEVVLGGMLASCCFNARMQMGVPFANPRKPVSWRHLRGLAGGKTEIAGGG